MHDAICANFWDTENSKNIEKLVKTKFHKVYLSTTLEKYLQY